MQIGLTTPADVAPNQSDSQLKPNWPQPHSGIHSIHSYQPGPLAQVFMEIYPQVFMEVYPRVFMKVLKTLMLHMHVQQ